MRITQSTNAARAKEYFSSADYYIDGQERPGLWRGEGGKLLGLSGEITRGQWEALCDHLDPRSGDRLFQRRKDVRSVGYDFTFSAQKSVSVLYAVTKDERLVDAFQAAVDSTMGEVEKEMQTRVRKGGKNEDRRTGNMVIGNFLHFTSRPVAGIPDPQLHSHCFALNVTFDKEERAWKAGQFREIVRDAGYYQAMFEARFARNLTDLGLPVERTRTGWQLAGVSRSFVEKFSQRTAQIERLAKAKGIADPKAKGRLGAMTREEKVKNLSLGQLQEAWRERMTPAELDRLAALEKLVGSGPLPQDDSAASRALDFAIGHEFERRSVVPERKLLATAFKQAIGVATPEQVMQQVSQAQLLIASRRGRSMATTREVLAEEERVIEFARKGRGAARPLVGPGYKLKRTWLNASQERAVRHILESRDRVILVRGQAGVGKTTLMQEAVEAIEQSGAKVTPLAPTAEASRGVLRTEGFSSADTVARLLTDEKFQETAKDSVLWIDEAGLVGIRTLAQVFDLAKRIGARLLLSGDPKQHASVERGASLRLLETEAGLKAAEVKEIQRQKDKYKAAVKELAEGKAAVGFDRLDELGWIRELPAEERYAQLARDYVAAIKAKESTLVVSPTHREGDWTTAAIRAELRSENRLGREERALTVLENANLTEAERGDATNYLSGDVIQFHQNAKGYRRGQRLEAGVESLPLDLAARFSAYRTRTLHIAKGDLLRITQNAYSIDGKHRLDNGSVYRVKSFDRQGSIVLENGWKLDKHFGHLAYGYVMTSPGSQAKTVDRVFLAQSGLSYPATSREQFYVSCSRGRESVTVYCEDKETLRDAVTQTDERLSASEMVAAHVRRELVAEFERSRHEERVRSQVRELAYER